jgi:putative oxidoreductase
MITTFNKMLDRPDLAKLILRVAFGGMMLLHGLHKMAYGINDIIALVVRDGMPPFVGYGVYIGEIVMPIMLILGILVRPAALIFCINLLFAWLITTPGMIFSFNKVGGWGLEDIAVFFFAGVAIAFLGGGRYSIIKNAYWR